VHEESGGGLGPPPETLAGLRPSGSAADEKRGEGSADRHEREFGARAHGLSLLSGSQTGQPRALDFN
jgi:hypothetical protein